MTTFWTQLEADANLGDGNDNLASALEGALVSPLRQYGFVGVEGPDGHGFLQGQTTTDFRQVTGAQARAGAYCTPKGRMLTSFVAATPAEHRILLRMRRDIVANTLTVLGKYAVFSKVSLSDASNGWVALGLAGRQAGELLKSTLGAAPQAHFEVCEAGQGLALQTDTGGERFELWLPEEAAFDCWQRLVQQARPMSSAVWDELNIDAGIGEVCAATVEAFIPQMLNFDATGAVNFKKGCYTGQEVVARLHYRGSVKRRLYRARFDGGEAHPGDAVYAEESTQAIGNVAGATATGKALVVLSREAATATDLRLASGAHLTQIEPPPYEVKE